MKKVFSFWSWAMILALCVGFVSCSEDDDGGGGNNEFFEATINGKTDKEPSMGYVTGVGELGYALFEVTTADFDFSAFLQFYSKDRDLKNSVSGEYKVKDMWKTYSYENFDLAVGFSHNDVLLSGGKHNVTTFKLLESNDREATYLIGGNFSCSIKTSDNTTYNITGKYQTIVDAVK